MIDYIKGYTDFLEKFLRPKRPVKVIFDCSNGTTGIVLEKLFRDPSPSSGRPSVFLINEKPDGRFPAHGPNPLVVGALDQLGAKVRPMKADCGAVFDADGDRVFFTDELGRLLKPAAAILLLAGRFPGDLVLPANIGPYVRRQLAERGQRVTDSRVGHYFLKKVIKERKLAFAAEQSGHYYFQKFFNLDSGIFAALQFINAVSELDQPLSAWVDALPPAYVSDETNFTVADKAGAIAELEKTYAPLAEKVERLDGLSLFFDDWWLNVRSSNTENLLRLNLEADSAQLYEQKMAELGRLLSADQ